MIYGHILTENWETVHWKEVTTLKSDNSTCAAMRATISSTLYICALGAIQIHIYLTLPP